MMRTERLILCANWGVPSAHQAISRVQFGTSLLHMQGAGGRRGSGAILQGEKIWCPTIFFAARSQPDAPPAASGQVRKSGKGDVFGSVFRVVEG